MPQRMPNLFIVGAMRAGTTALHDALAAHPQILMSHFKEPAFFADPEQLATDSEIISMAGYCGNRDRYLALFDGAGDRVYAGESSTHYTKAPRITEVAPRIAEMSADARIVYVVRDPVERTLSHYRYAVRRKTERLPALEAFRADDFYCAVSDYAMQIDPYLDVFGAHQVKVVVLERLAAAGSTEMDRLYEWLGVDAAGTNGFEQRNALAKTVAVARGPAALHELGRSRGYQRVARTIIPRAVRTKVRTVLNRDQDASDVRTEPVLEYLRGIHAPQVARFEQLVGDRFPEWSTVSGA